MYHASPYINTRADTKGKVAEWDNLSIWTPGQSSERVQAPLLNEKPSYYAEH